MPLVFLLVQPPILGYAPRDGGKVVGKPLLRRESNLTTVVVRLEGSPKHFTVKVIRLQAVEVGNRSAGVVEAVADLRHTKRRFQHVFALIPCGP